MNRMNDKGIKLLEFKRELAKEYPQIIKESLNIAAQQLAENEIIDANTLLLLRDESQSYTAFERYLSDNQDFMKTDEEIYEEFELIRGKLDDVMERHGLGELETESVVGKECILAKKMFAMDYKFTMDYFQVNEGDAMVLMKRRGFIEKFSVLRFDAIFHPFVKEMQQRDLEVKVMLSKVYYEKNLDVYAIDFYFELPIDLIEEESNIPDLCLEMRAAVEEAEAHYKQKMVC